LGVSTITWATAFLARPNNVATYVKNIRDGLSKADPDGAADYARNADAYVAQLKELDAWIGCRSAAFLQSAGCS